MPTPILPHWSDYFTPPITQNGVYQVNPAIGIGQQYNMCLYDVLNYGYDLGLKDYPIWDETQRDTLNQVIVNHFMWREIRGETPRQFIYFLNRAMNENMPGINPIFEALDNISTDDLTRNAHSVTKHEGESTNNVTQKANAYTSTNPKETMVGKDPTLYYNAGQFNNANNDAVNHIVDSYTNDSNGNIIDALARWSIGTNNPLDILFNMLEKCFCQLIRPNLNIY